VGLKSFVKNTVKREIHDAKVVAKGTTQIVENVVQTTCDIKCDKCGKLIPPIVSKSKTVNGKIYQFCSDECANAFK